MSRSGITPADLISNIVVLIGLAIGGAFLVDSAWTWWGGEAFAVCAVYDVVDVLLGQTLGLLLVVVGLAGWLFSSLRQGGYLALALGGLFIGMAPNLFASYLGATCG